MAIYTYVVDHGQNHPAVGAHTEINGGRLQAVMFDDALTRLEEIEGRMENLELQAVRDAKSGWVMIPEVEWDSIMKPNA